MVSIIPYPYPYPYLCAGGRVPGDDARARRRRPESPGHGVRGPPGARWYRQGPDHEDLRTMRRTLPAIILGIVVAVAAAAYALSAAPWRPDAPGATPSATSSGTPTRTPPDASDGAGPTTAPPSTQEPDETPALGEDAEPEPVPAAPGAIGVDVLVTYAEWNAADSVVEVGAYVAAVENAGTCTLTLTSAGRTATATMSALPDAATMSCGGLVVPRAQLAAGTWSAVVGYASATSTGTSPAVEVVVP